MLKPLERKVETWNGKRVVVYRPNPKYPRERALKELEEMLTKIARRLNKQAS